MHQVNAPYMRYSMQSELRTCAMWSIDLALCVLIHCTAFLESFLSSLSDVRDSFVLAGSVFECI